MKNIVAFTLAAGLIASSASAKVSFSLDIEALTEGDGVSTISDSGLIVLVVDTGEDGFQLPSAGALASGNDEVVTYWDLDDYSFTSPDITLLSEGGVSYGSNWSEDDKLALFWFPTLSSANMVPASDTVYGVFADAVGLSSGDGWFMPADGTLVHNLTLLTAAATKLVQYGDVPASAGKTAFAVNNAPSTAAPATPSLGVTNGAGKSTLTWTASGASDGFIVQRKLPNGNWESIGVADAGDTSFEDTNVQPGRDYEYRLYSIGTFAATLSNLPAAITSERLYLTNVSARSRVVAGSPVTQMFGGVIIDGDQDSTKDIILQAIGKSRLGAGYIEDPKIDLYQSRVLFSSNDDWMESARVLDIDAAMGIGNAIQLGDDGSKDSSDLVSATVGKGYSFAVASQAGDTADLFMGIFDANYKTPSDTSNTNRIANLSARGFLGDDAGSLFAGSFIVRGTPGLKKEVLVMAWGPYLSTKADTSLEGLTVVDPEINMWKGSNIVATNDNWENQTVSSADGYTFETDVERIKRVVDALGYRPLDEGSPDAVLLMTVDPGAYAFSYTGKGGTGIGFITIDEVENID